MRTKRISSQLGFVSTVITTLIVVGLVSAVIILRPGVKPVKNTDKNPARPTIATSEPSLSATPSASIVSQASSSPVKNAAEKLSVFDCSIQASADRVPPPATFYFTANPLNAASGSVKTVEWDINGDGSIDATSTGAEYSYTFKEPGDYNIRSRISLQTGAVSNWCIKKVEAKYHDVKCDIYPNPKSGKAPLHVYLDTGIYSDAVLDNTGIEAYQWDFDGDGNWDTSFNNERVGSYTFNDPKAYTVRLQVKTKSGRLSPVCTAAINVTN